MFLADASDFWFKVFDDVVVNHLRLIYYEKTKWFSCNQKMSAVDRKEYSRRVEFQKKDPERDSRSQQILGC
jgi:hypothetical protein